MAAALRIGFVGATGLMGHGMAKNLVRKGFPTTLLVRPGRASNARLADILQAGAAQTPSAAELARRSDVVLMCVTGSAEVESVVFGGGAEALAAGARRGLVVVDSSTSEVAQSAATRERLAALGVAFVDAPLTRTPAAAEAGSANCMVGADEATFARLRPVFAAYCEHIIHAGPAGHGLVLKLINNFVGQAITTATAEGLATAAKAGLDLRALHRLMSLGSVNNLMFQFMLGTMLEGGPERLNGLKFSLGNAMKDLRAYTHLSEGLGVPSPVGEAVHQSLVQANALGLGDKFIASLITAQEKINNVVIDKYEVAAPGYEKKQQ
jgi:3-hydroxyisobutyrate dehydrogenase-like beta-hydroxyacid dehydrogenase